MEPILSPWLFWLIGVLEALSCVFFIFAFIFGFGSFLLLAIKINDSLEKDEREKSDTKKLSLYLKRFLVGAIVSIFIVTIIPTKSTCYLMLAADNITEQRLEKTGEKIEEAFIRIIDAMKDKDTEDTD